MRITKKALSLILALLMIVSILPIAAFALDGSAFELTGNSITVDGTTDQTVEIILKAKNAETITTLQGTFTETSEYIALTDYTFPVELTGTNKFNVSTGEIIYVDDTNFTGFNVAEAGNVIVAKYSVDKATPSGSYEVKFDLASVAGADLIPTSEHSYFTAEINVTNTSTPSGGEGGSTGSYTASMSGNSANAATIRVGNTIKIDLGVNAAYSATQMTVTYPSNLVTFDASNSALGTATVNSATAGTLELADYGVNKNADTDNYVLAFTAVSDGTASFELTSAKFGTGTTSENASLTVATLPSALSVVINKAQHTVTLPNIFAGATSVEDGATYTFTPETATGAYYNYTITSVTMNGADVTANLSGDATSGWSITNVTGPLVITGTRSEKSYNVTINTVFGEETTTTTGTATYNTPYEFTVPNDVAAGENVGYTYTLTSVSVNGTTYTGYSVADGTRNYTIPGADVKGDIVITITKTEEAANTFNVSITGEGAGQVSANPTKVTKGNSVTLTLTPDAGYTYVIKVNGQEVTLTNNQYTITNVQSAADVTVTVEKNLTTTYMTSDQYVQLNGTVMWLVKIAPTNPADATSAQISGKTYIYNSTNMYWSSAYNAYVTLVVAESAPTLAASDFAIVSVDTIPTITYDMNVNMSDDNVVDPADAQLVWNMYSAVYEGISTNVSVEKFLKADVNADGKVSTADAAAIIASVLKLTTT